MSSTRKLFQLLTNVKKILSLPAPKKILALPAGSTTPVTTQLQRDLFPQIRQKNSFRVNDHAPVISIGGKSTP